MRDQENLLRHFLAALAYRTQKALRDAPAELGSFRAAPKARTPHELVGHMNSVLGYATTFFLTVGSTGTIQARRRIALKPLVSMDRGRPGWA